MQKQRVRLRHPTPPSLLGATSPLTATGARFTPATRRLLEELIDGDLYPTTLLKKQIAARVGLSLPQINNYLKKKRMASKD